MFLFTYANRFLITCAFRLHIHYLFIYLFIYLKRCQQKQRKSPPVFIYLWKLFVDYMCFSFKYSLSICLFIQRDVNKSSASHHLFLFTYGNYFLITCAFRLNIHNLFLYLFKVMSTKAGGSDHLFLFTYGNHLLLIRVFVLISIIYLFIYSKRCQQKQVELTTFIYLRQSLVVRHGFRLNIQYLFIYLFKTISTKAGGRDHLFLFTYGN